MMRRTEMNTIIKLALRFNRRCRNYIKLQINLANVYRFEKKYDQAEELYLKAMAQKEKKLGKPPGPGSSQKGIGPIVHGNGQDR